MRQRGQRKSQHSGEIAGLLSGEAAGIEPADTAIGNLRQDVLLPTIALISRRFVVPPHPVFPVLSRSHPRWRGTLGAHAAPQGQPTHGRERPAFPSLAGLTRSPWEADGSVCPGRCGLWLCSSRRSFGLREAEEPEGSSLWQCGPPLGEAGIEAAIGGIPRPGPSHALFSCMVADLPEPSLSASQAELERVDNPLYGG